MEKSMIQKIDKFLENLNDRNINIKQQGFILSKIIIENFKYEIEKEILNLKDVKRDIYMTINLNQVYKVEIGNNKLKLYLDNDLEIILELNQ